MRQYFIIAIYLLFTLLGIIFIKKGGESLVLDITTRNLTLQVGLWSFLGLICYLLSFLLWMTILPKFNLSYIVPVTVGIVQILTLLSAVLIFSEKISGLKLLGILLIIIGAVLINF